MATTVPQQNQSSGVNTLPLIVFGVLSLVFGLFMWWIIPSLGVLPPAASVEADRTDALFQVLIGIAGVVFFLVQGLIYYAAIAFRAKPNDTTDGPNIHGNVMLEIVWTIVPSVIVVFIAIYAYNVWSNNTQPHDNANMMFTAESTMGDDGALNDNVVINAIGQRYAWSFEYITNDFADAFNEDETVIENGGDRIVINTSDLYIYAGQEVDINMNTRDVIHSFWAPEMRVKQDLLPGRTTSVQFTPRLPDDAESWENVMVHNPVTIYTEPSTDAPILFEVVLEEDALPEPVEIALAMPDESELVNGERNIASANVSLKPETGSEWIRVLDERGRIGYLSIDPSTSISRFNRYRLICTELCGGGHGDMYTDIVMLEDADTFMEVWYEPTIEILSIPFGNPIDFGESVIETYPCSGCHALEDLGWFGAQGPALNGIGSRSTERASASSEATGNQVTSGAEYIVQSIRLSQGYQIPGYAVVMPYFHPGNGDGEMPQEELIGITSYLCTQTSSGNPVDSDCGLTNWEFDENGEFVGDVDALVAELTEITNEYED